jgi:anthranilate phosphoribosyltransferase
VFNLLGPLTNPAGARRQLIGAPSVEFAQLMANALAGLGPERAYVVHGSDGLDEVTTTGATTVFEVRQDRVQMFSWTPADFGVEPASAAGLTGGDRAANRKIAVAILQGQRGPRRDIVVVNAAAALLAAEVSADIREAVRRAGESIDTGAAWAKVEKLAEFCRAVQVRASK